LSIDIHEHPKFRILGHAITRYFEYLLAQSMRHRMAGVFTAELLESYWRTCFADEPPVRCVVGPRGRRRWRTMTFDEALARMLDVGTLEDHGEGQYAIHDYGVWQPVDDATTADVGTTTADQRARALARERVARYRERKRNAAQSAPMPGAAGVTCNVTGSVTSNVTEDTYKDRDKDLEGERYTVTPDVTADVTPEPTPAEAPMGDRDSGVYAITRTAEPVLEGELVGPAAPGMRSDAWVDGEHVVTYAPPPVPSGAASLPESIGLTAEMESAVMMAGLPRPTQAHVDAMLDWHRARSIPSADWTASLRSWMRKEPNFGGRRGGIMKARAPVYEPAPPPPPRTAEDLARFDPEDINPKPLSEMGPAERLAWYRKHAPKPGAFHG
jgi:hypothetical protein